MPATRHIAPEARRSATGESGSGIPSPRVTTRDGSSGLLVLRLAGDSNAPPQPVSSARQLIPVDSLASARRSRDFVIAGLSG
jgi:hypothetical protein